MPKGPLIPRLRKPRARSAVSNGTRLFVDKKVSGAYARRYADLISDFVYDLGGPEAVGAMKMSLIRRAAALTLEAERLETSLAMGEPVDVDLLSRISGQLRRLGEAVGLDRVQKKPPTIAEIAERIRAEKAR